VLKERYSAGMTLTGALAVAIAALASQKGNGDQPDITAAQLEVAVLDRAREHRAFRRLTGARLEALLAEARPAGAAKAADPAADDPQKAAGAAKPADGADAAGASGPDAAGADGDSPQ
jgi:proteasome alpha subunit